MHMSASWAAVFIFMNTICNAKQKSGQPVRFFALYALSGV